MSLYDKLTRHQVYFEGVKSWFSSDFNDTLDVLNRRVMNIFLDAPERQLGDLTAAQYRNFERRLSRQLDSIIKRSKEVLWSDLQNVNAADNEMLQDILKSERSTRRKMPSNAVVWNQVTKRTVGATGTTLDEMIDAFYANLKATILKEVRKARIDNDSVDDLITTMKGTRAANNRDGLMNKFKNQSNSVLATALQHITSVSQNQYERIFYERYRWVAILDSRTTQICRSRNGKTWAYGKGPVPPAHYNCRSKIVPVDDDRRNYPETYFGWLREQPFNVLSDIVGIEAARRISAGKGSDAEFPEYMSERKLNVNQFKNKLSLILETGSAG